MAREASNAAMDNAFVVSLHNAESDEVKYRDDYDLMVMVVKDAMSMDYMLMVVLLFASPVIRSTLGRQRSILFLQSQLPTFVDHSQLLSLLYCSLWHLHFPEN